MRTIWVIIIVIVLIATYSPVHADDTTARVGVGGITFLKSADIRMVQENLKISTNNIYVRYRFLNESNKDILTTVAFPLPTYGWNPGQSQSTANEKPLESFSLKINGKEIKTTKTRRALLIKHVVKNGEVEETLGRDITKELKATGLSDKQIFETFADSYINRGFHDSLNKQQKINLRKIGAWERGEGDGPNWKVAATAHWQQLFPANKEIEVEHMYQPFVGNLYSVPYQGEHQKKRKQQKSDFVYDIPIILDKDPKEACVSEETKQKVNQQIKSLIGKGTSKGWVTVYMEDVEFILSTGRNWKGPIGNFTLTIEKKFPDQVISVCFPRKPKVINSTVLEFSQNNYVPQDKLVVYFYTVKAE